MPMHEEVSYSVKHDALRVCDMPAQLRPREEFERVGAENVSDAVLLALILRTGTKGMNVVEVSQRLLSSFGSLTALAKASEKEIQSINSIGPVKAQMIKAAMELAQRLTRESVGESPMVVTPEQAAAVLRERARILQKEVFWALMLDAKNRLIGEPQKISEGTLTSSLVHPRELFKKALELSCASMILAHNHPSGDPTPSAEDIKVTRQLIGAGEVMGIKVLDHIVIGHRRTNSNTDFLSLREAGLVRFN
ncbi:DNA repair protein RadC [Pontiella sp. NLcol2]|uniref:DNA repair protein RadC n=2 Tax=Pontiella agarivorans TaxID=3038953 RepID=A0ABU5N1G6_9BACT|nr:DNA repair protein RadC [Pontiella agarivorans]